MRNPTFINYTHPSEQSNRQNRRTVASYIGTHYRNRSRPSARKAPNPNDPPTSTPPAVFSDSGDDIHGEHPSLPIRRQKSPRRPTSASNQHLPAPNLEIVVHDKHGFRSDPFNAYPIEFRACIPAAIDFFVGFYGPAHVIRPEVLSARTGTVMLQRYFQYALQDPVMFEAIIALSQANLTIQTWVSNGPDKDAIYHYSRALHRLRKTLLKQDGYTKDSVLFAIVALMGVDYLLNDLAAFEMHIGGVRRIVSLRGGLDRLGWPMILKPYLVGLEGFWAYISQNQDNMPNIHQHDQSMSESLEDLNLSCPYNREPIAELGEMIPALPSGFRDLTLNYRLSVPVITFLHRVVTEQAYINQVASVKGVREINAANLQEAEYCVRLLACTDLTVIERACCIGVLIAVLGCTRSERFSPLYAQQIRHHSMELLSWQAKFADTDLAECFLWVSLDLAGTMFPQGQACVPTKVRNDSRYLLLMATAERYQHLQWEDVIITMRRFLWTTSRLHSCHNAWQFGQNELEERRITNTSRKNT